MTQEEIIEIAQGCGLVGMRPHLDGIYVESLVAFANLVAQEVRDRIMFGSRDDWVLAEREACAKVADLVAREIDDTNGTSTYIAAAIRARGQA